MFPYAGTRNIVRGAGVRENCMHQRKSDDDDDDVVVPLHEARRYEYENRGGGDNHNRCQFAATRDGRRWLRLARRWG